MKRILLATFLIGLTHWLSGQITTNTNFKVNSNNPIDNRMTIATLGDTSTISFPFEGLLVHVNDADNFYKYNGLTWEVFDPGGGGAVDSVNGNTGVVVLDPDDLDDSSTTNKFTTASDISKLAGIEANAKDDQNADEVPLSDANNNYSSSDVEGAFNELGYEDFLAMNSGDTLFITRQHNTLLVSFLQGATQTLYVDATNAPKGAELFIKTDGMTSFTLTTTAGNIAESGESTGSSSITMTGTQEKWLRRVLSGWIEQSSAQSISSVNGQSGTVVLDADDIDDTSTTNKFTTAGDVSKLAGIESGATADQSDAEIETAYNNQVAIVSKQDAEIGIDTVPKRWTPNRVSQAIKAQTYDGSNALIGVLGYNAKNYNHEYDFIPNTFSLTPPQINVLSPDSGYNIGGTMLLGFSGGSFSANVALNEFGEPKADRLVASYATNGKLLLQINSTIYPDLLPGDYNLKWKLRAETGVDTIKWGQLNSETPDIELDTTWTEFNRTITYTGGTTYTTIVAEDSSDISVLVGDIIMTPAGHPYKVSTQPQDGHAYSIRPNNFQYDVAGMLYRPQLTIAPADSINLDTVCVTAVVKPDWENVPSVPSYGDILSSRDDYNDFWMGTFLDSTFQMYTPIVSYQIKGINSISYLHTDRAYVIVVQTIDTLKRVYLNGVMIGQSGYTPKKIHDLRIGGLNGATGNRFPGYIEDVSIYRGISDPVLLTKQLMASTQLGKEVRTDKCVFGEGDSISTGNDAACKLSSKKTKIVSARLAVGGSQMDDVNSRKSALKNAIAQAKKIYDKVIVTVHMGANDLTTASVYYDTIINYVRELQAVGALVAVCTVLPQNAQPGTFETNRIEYNQMLRDSDEIDGVIDYDTTIMGDYSTTSNTTYYSDGTHPTPAGQAIMEPVYTAVINSL